LPDSDDDIDLAVEAIQASAGSAEPLPGLSEQVADLSRKLANLEAALEGIGLENQFRTELSDYIKDLRRELAFVQRARYATGIYAAFAATLLFVTPVLISAFHFRWFAELPAYVEAALLIGMFAAGVLLVLAITKSVFRSAAERQGDDFIPPQLKLIHEMVAAVKS